MPRLNSTGEYAMGVAGTQGSINGVLVPDSYGPWWFNDDEVVFAQPSDGTIKIMSVDSGIRTNASPFPPNDYRGGGSNWAAWANGRGLYSPNLNLPEAGLKDVGPDGAIGYVPNYQSGIGCVVSEMNGTRWTLSSGIVYDLQLLGNLRAIWRDEGFRIRTIGIPPCIQIGNAYRPRATFINNEWWVCYWSEPVGVVLHPFNSTVGYTIVPPGIDAFNHDAVALSNDIEKVVWSTTQGELPEHYREKFTNVLTESRKELAPKIEIPMIDKPCWLCWFEFVNDLAYIPPCNSFMWVKQTGKITKLDRTQFAQWAQGDTVEEIERQDNGQYPIVAYWDSRFWPRLPNLRPNSWTAIQAYCKSSETPIQFELSLRNYINSLPNNRKYCLVCQCYTDNNSLTKDIIEIIPVFARLARDYPQIDFLMPFNDQGRGNSVVGGGLQWNPAAKPYWEQLYSGIAGEPEMAEVLPQNVYDTLVRLRPKYPTPMGDNGAKLLNEVAWIHRDEGYGLHRKPGGSNCPQTTTGARCSCDILRTRDSWYDVLGDAEGVATPTQGEKGVSTDPENWVAPVQPPDAPTTGKVIILDYDRVCKRSNPLGCLIRYEVESPNPVTETEFDLEGDGEPSIKVMFTSEVARDGRYVRGFAFKFTVNGQWVLRVTAKDNQGNVYKSDGSQVIEVTF